MKKPLQTFYVFKTVRYADSTAKPRLIKLEGSPHGEFDIKLSKWSPTLFFKTIVSRDALETTPEAALAHYRKICEDRVANLEAELANARKALALVPDVPGEPVEETSRF